MSRCCLLLAVALLATGGQALPSEHREARGLADWFGWATPAQPEPPARRVQRPVLQRRGGQFVGDDIKESFLRQSQARILSRPKPRRNETPRKKVTQPRPSQVNKRKLLMPVIISSYASTSIQGHGNEEHEEKNTIEETNQPKATKNSAKEDAFREAQAQSKAEETTEADEPKLATQSTTAAPRSTITTTVATTAKESPTETTQEAVLENAESTTEAVETNEVADYDQSPYLPALPDSLDSERILVLGREPDQVADRRSSETSGTYLAGYQQIQTNKKVRFPGDKTGRDGTTREREDRPAPPRQSKPDFYPLGKAPGKASGKTAGKAGSSKPIIPKKKLVPHPLRHLPPPPPPKPVKEVEASSSFFDFLPFWKAGPASPVPAPPRPSRRPAPPGRRAGPTVTQAPLLLKVGSAQDAPSRPIHRASAHPAPARIDNRIYTEGEDPFVVLPAAPPKPSLPRRGPLPPRRAPPPKPSGRPHASLRPKNTRLGTGHLPMTSQPVIGLPQVPPSRKQSPFISRRPQLPPRVPGPSKAFPPPRKPLAQRKNLSARKPFPSKSHLPHPKLGPKKPPTPEITLKPNGSNQPAGAIASHLSSLLSSFFSTTVSPARPPAALPSLVEDTEFANVVNGIRHTRL